MVFTPLHYPQAIMVYYVLRRKVPFTAVLIGSFLLDFEVPILKMFKTLNLVDVDRLILHSIVRVLTIGVAIGLAVLRIYEKILRMLLGLGPNSMNIFRNCIGIVWGALGHVLLDNLHHQFNPTLWPFVDNLRRLILFGDPYLASYITHLVMLALTVGIVIVELYMSKLNTMLFLRGLLYDP